jgi:class 3 adenylate cyclase
MAGTTAGVLTFGAGLCFIYAPSGASADKEASQVTCEALFRRLVSALSDHTYAPETALGVLNAELGVLNADPIRGFHNFRSFKNRVRQKTQGRRWMGKTPDDEGHRPRNFPALATAFLEPPDVISPIDRQPRALLDRYGYIPAFRAGLHAGSLVAGEIGGFKREITLIGDAMNTAERIEQACRDTGHNFLASKPLLDRTKKPADVVATGIGEHLLRGKSECIQLFALERRQEREQRSRYEDT